MTTTADRRVVVRVLNGALAVEARSSLAYGLQISEGCEDDVDDGVRQRLVELRSQLAEAARTLANLILDHRGTPDPGNFPLVATNYNFLNVDVLLSRLEPTIPADIARLEELAGALNEPADVHDLIAGLAKQKAAQLKLVQELLAALNPPKPEPEPAADDAAAE